MCGIVACYAKEGCYEKLLSALSRLEYRGYDSAGIALLCGGNFSVRKRAGGVSNLNGPPLPGIRASDIRGGRRTARPPT